MDPLILNSILAVEMAVSRQNSAVAFVGKMSEKRSRLSGKAGKFVIPAPNEDQSEVGGLFKAARSKLNAANREWIKDAVAWIVVPFVLAEVVMAFTYILTLALASALSKSHLAAFGLFVGIRAKALDP